VCACVYVSLSACASSYVYVCMHVCLHAGVCKCAWVCDSNVMAFQDCIAKGMNPRDYEIQELAKMQEKEMEEMRLKQARFPGRGRAGYVTRGDRGDARGGDVGGRGRGRGRYVKICVCVCTCEYVYEYAHVKMLISIFEHPCVRLHVYVWTHVRRAYVHVCICSFFWLYTHTNGDTDPESYVV